MGVAPSSSSFPLESPGNQTGPWALDNHTCTIYKLNHMDANCAKAICGKAYIMRVHSTFRAQMQAALIDGM